MDETLRDTIVSLAAFAAGFGIIYVYFMTRHRERMTMLERGIAQSPFNSIRNANYIALKYGMLLVGISIGIIMGAVLRQLGVEESTSFLSMIFLFAGLSLILNHLITKKTT